MKEKFEEDFEDFVANHTRKECKLVADTICFVLTKPSRAELMMGFLRMRMKEEDEAKKNKR